MPLIYKVSSRIANATQRNTDSEKERGESKKENKVYRHQREVVPVEPAKIILFLKFLSLLTYIMYNLVSLLIEWILPFNK